MSNLNSEIHGDGSSTTIEEANALRMKLGLAPLEVTGDNDEVKKQDFVHRPAENISERKERERYENKIKIRQETRERNEKLAKEKHLSEPYNNSTEDFLKKIKAKAAKLEAEKAKAEAKASESDENEIEQMDVSYTEPKYGSKDLSGLQIEHKASRLEFAGPTILTLRDHDILDEDQGNVLVNPNLVDLERSEKNLRNKKMGAYGDYIDSGDEEDPLSALKPTSVLAKYDESIEGEKRNRFTLDSRGKYCMTQERAEEDSRKNIFTGKLQVFNTDMKIASDYYTTDEIKEKFKLKKRKARGMKTTNTFTPKVEPKVESVKPKKEEGELAEEEVKKKPSTKRERVVPKFVYDDSDEDDYRPALILPDIESTVVNMNVRHQLELKKKLAPKVSAMSTINNDENKVESGQEKKIVITETEEYTKNVLNILHSKRKMDAEDAAKVKEEPIVKPPRPVISKVEVKEEEEPVQSSGWQPEEKIVSLPPQPTKKKRNFRETPVLQPQEKKKLKLTDGILGDEVQINAGIYSTLLLVRNKGYLEEEKKPKLITNPKNKMLRAQHYQEEKIRYDDIDQKCPRRERRGLPESPFTDKTDFKPDIKLDYLDDFGRTQPPKEAFRSLSHSFHGKTSGKIKSEKRLKKMQEQTKINSSIGDRESNNMTKMQTKMKNEKRFCVPLSGKNSIIPTAIKKHQKK